MSSRMFWCVVVASLLLSFGAAAVAQSPCFKFIRGDADADGDVDWNDQTAVGNCVFYSICTGARDASDVNDDGQLTTTDIVYIGDYLNGYISSLPAPWPSACYDPGPEDPIDPGCTELSGDGTVSSLTGVPNVRGWRENDDGDNWDTHNFTVPTDTSRGIHKVTNSDNCDRTADHVWDELLYEIDLDPDDSYGISGRLARSMVALGDDVLLTFPAVNLDITATIGGDCNTTECYDWDDENRVEVNTVADSTSTNAEVMTFWRADSGSAVWITHEAAKECVFGDKYRENGNIVWDCDCETEWLFGLNENQNCRSSQFSAFSDEVCWPKSFTRPTFATTFNLSWDLCAGDFADKLPDTLDIYRLETIRVNRVKAFWYGSGPDVQDHDISSYEELKIEFHVPAEDTVSVSLSCTPI